MLPRKSSRQKNSIFQRSSPIDWKCHLGNDNLRTVFEAEIAEMVGHYYYSQIDNRYRLKMRGNA